MSTSNDQTSFHLNTYDCCLEMKVYDYSRSDGTDMFNVEAFNLCFCNVICISRFIRLQNVPVAP